MSMPEAQKMHSKTFYILDFDRTLADSEKLFNLFVAVAGRYTTIPSEQITAAHEQMVAKGDSFDTASYIRDHMLDVGEGDNWNELEKQFIREARTVNMLLPGASEILDELRSRSERFGILTYGNPLWQHLKLSATGFNHVHRIITVNKHKGALVASWQLPDRTFKLPEEYGGGTAEELVMIDDKAVSFENFPSAPSRGYYVVDLENALPSQQGSVPGNVTHVDTLAQAQAHLFI